MEQTLRIALPPRRLIINADDLGLCPERDAGILQLFSCGAITSASLLVQGESAKAAALAAVAAGLPLGLHLNLSEGRPAASPATSHSLTDTHGALRGKFGLRAALAAGLVQADDLAREIRAQFDAFIALTGELPSHVDGHHHSHVEALVAAVLAPIMAREYGVYCVRLPREAALPETASDPDFDAVFQKAVAQATCTAAPVFAAHGIYSTEAFLGQSLMGHRLQPAAIGAALAALEQQHKPSARQPLRVELMVHPGIPATDARRGDFCRSAARAHEMTVLKSAEWRSVIAGWEAASFRDLCRPLADNPDRSRPSVLIYGKLTPATGNAETARRYAAAWSPQAEIRFRPTPADIASPQALACEARRLQEFALRERLDLAFGIHLYRAGAPLAEAFASADAPPLPYGLLASGTDANADIDIPAHRAAIGTALAQADFLVCLNGAQQERLATLHRPEDRAVLGNGIDIATDSPYSLRATLGLAAKTLLVLFPASLRQIKGVLPLIEALAETLATRFPKHVLVILGPPLEAAYAEAVRSRIASLTAAHPSLHRRLVLHDGLAHADYLAALKEAALVLNASEHEGLSHGLMEAMAAGIPVLARNIPGNRLLLRNGENGRLFDSFAELPAAYAACFAEPAHTGRMVRQAGVDIALHHSATQEAEALRNMLERSLKRRQATLPMSDGSLLHLDLASGTHPMSAENVALFRHIELSPAAAARWPETLPLAVDVGCGCGVFGLLLLDALAGTGRKLQRLRFTDTHQPSLAALSRTLTRHRQQLPMLEQACLMEGSLLDPLLQTPEKAQLICANLPQTPGPAALAATRPDRCGGDDGAGLICALIAQLPAVLAEDGEVFLLHISLAHPARLASMLATHGLQATVLAEQPRRTRLAEYEAMQPGLAAYLLAAQAAGRAEFTLDGDSIDFHARLLRISRAG